MAIPLLLAISFVCFCKISLFHATRQKKALGIYEALCNRRELLMAIPLLLAMEVCFGLNNL